MPIIEHKLPVDFEDKLIIKNESYTDPNVGTPPDKRPITEYINNGIINLDKPSGPTSHEISSWVRRILNADKTGHAGTLDPRVTGVLPVGINNSCKVLQALLKAGKEYVCIMHIHKKVSEEEIRSILIQFVGKIYQRPPLRSSVKQLLRIREIYYLDILEIEERNVLFVVGCEAGTYIRKLVYDFGLVFGTGAHMRELRRTRVGPFNENEHIYTLQDIQDAYHYWKNDGNEDEIRKVILPIEYATSGLLKIIIRDSAVDAICHGAKLTAPGILKLSSTIKPGSLVAILTLKNELVALGKSMYSTKQILELEHGIVAQIERVVMEPNIYPSWKLYK